MANTKSSVDERTEHAQWTFNNMGSVYEDNYSHVFEQHVSIDWLLSQLKPQSNILDIGSGTGKPTAYRLANAGHEVTGLDVSETMIRLAQKSVPSGDFKLVDVRTFSAPPNTFDAVCSFYSLFYMTRADIRQTIKNIHNWLKEGGVYVLAMLPGDYQDTTIPWMGIHAVITSMPLEEYLSWFREVGFEIRRYTVAEYAPTSRPKEKEDDLFICAQKVAKKDQSSQSESASMIQVLGGGKDSLAGSAQAGIASSGEDWKLKYK